MRKIITDLIRWREEGKNAVLATVIQTWGSAPRGTGANMAVSATGEMLGSVSGGCVEGAVVEAALESLANRQPRLLQYGITDETAWEVGLACGGQISVFVRPYDLAQLDFWPKEKTVATGMVVRGPKNLQGKSLLLDEDGHSVGALEGELHAQALDSLRGALQRNQSSGIMHLTPEVDFFLHVSHPPPTLVIIGGVHIAVALVALANTLEFRIIVIDPRKGFGNARRFPRADKIITAWPDQALRELTLTRTTAVAALTHDPKLDDPALIAALNSPAFYIGALGSHNTQEQRRQRLLNAGISAVQLDRIRGPIGLNLGGRKPEEIALAIMAEIVQEFPR
ncbi:MAG: XdhC family protein [Anaerolineales bacterium]|nr:XdhC family protein [Anaerolineales bacterium]